MQRYSPWVQGLDWLSRMDWTSSPGWRMGLGLLAALALGPLVSQGSVQGQGYEVLPPLPTGVVPVPTSPMPQGSAGDQQYVVWVSDTSEVTLALVQRIEPTAFRTTFQGQPVIQAGRFSHAANAQVRINDLASQGVWAQMSAAPAVQPIFAATPILPSHVYASSGALPSLPSGMPALSQGDMGVVPLPSGQASTNPVAFGQPFAYAAPSSPAPSYPVMMSPPNAAPLATPTSTPTDAPYYIVIPTAQANLQTLSTQVIQLGTPADRVQARTAPRGPHVAIGPFADRSLANQWNAFYRDAGLSNSRVFFQH